MQLRTLMFSIFLGLLSATVVTGCSEKKENKQESKQENKQENKQESGHGHSH